MIMNAMQSDFERMIRSNHRLVLLDILYWLPDHSSVLQEFIWQTMDDVPSFPRVYRFLDFWKENIEATISEIKIAHADPLQKTKFISVDIVKYI